METVKSLILSRLRAMVSTAMDLLQFAFRLNIRLDDKVIYLLHRAVNHQDCHGL